MEQRLEETAREFRAQTWKLMALTVLMALMVTVAGVVVTAVRL